MKLSLRAGIPLGLVRLAAPAAVLAAAVLAGSPADAKPAHLQSLGAHYGAFLPGAARDCGTCHLPSGKKTAESLADFPHNAFGKRVAALRQELAAKKRRSDISAVLRAIASEDSDGDRVPNEAELLTGSRPGDPRSRPSAKQLRALPGIRARFLAHLSAYRWRPFEPVARPSVPKVRNSRWVRNPVDAFVAAEHEKRGLKPRPEASKEVLLRRVYLDLIGLSPTPEERQAFLADRSPQAYEKVVDRLLASPRYGERWGRHWMDVWRYSDWTGYGEQVRDSLRHVWRWRDWIIHSLNSDKGYDRMVQEMLAGDELAPEDPETLAATGFLVRNYKLLSREKWLQDTVDHAGQAFLGITIGCARCHDHMYDPITQKEYYQLRAIFEPHNVRTDWLPGELDLAKDGLPRAFDARPDEPTYLYVRGDERQPDKSAALPPSVPEALGGALEIRPVPLPLLARVPEKQPHVISALREQAESRIAEARKAVEQCRSEEEASLAALRLEAAEAAGQALEAVLALERLEDAGKKDSPEWKQAAAETVRLQRRQDTADAALKRAEAARALAKAEKSTPARPDAVKKAREALAAAEEALKKAEAALKEPLTTTYRPRVTSEYPAASTGRRLAFARWLTDPRNPLTARVAVNHIWLRHFGQALVPSVADFGRGGTPPSHPRLVDWLATELMRNGWSMKQLHRLLVTSSTYRMASTPDPANLARDPDNRYLWRMNSRRMEAEIVRDNVLHVSGQLDLAMGGPDIDHHRGMAVKRRSVYFRCAQEKQMLFLSLFDGPNVVECYARKETVVPQQALALANSELALTQARLLARELAEKRDSDAGFVHAAFERVLARRAHAAELAECLRFLQEQTVRFRTTEAGGAAGEPKEGARPSADPRLRAREHLVLVLFNHHDFVTIR